jgi:radical SAM superfamily enzyme YgiQ (UPF0313 family)
MKLMLGYPPIPSDKGVPLLSQNRQFQWFNKPTFVYPMVPAYAATMARDAGHDVFWADGIAERWSPRRFADAFAKFAPDVLLIEAKTPIIKSYWRTIAELKASRPATMIALCGDHVTALPEESLEMSPVDFVITGGDYDFLLLDLMTALRHTGLKPLAGGSYPSGVWHRDENGVIRNTGAFHLDRDLNSLPMLDRDLTRWHLYSRENGNFKYTPGTYTMAGRDCWWGKCAFCSWTTIYNKWRARTPESLLDEVGAILDRYPVREIFDDTGCFPAGKWLRTFCEGAIGRGYNKRVVFGCNMIPGVLTQEHYNFMGEAGFRFVLFGLESASQSTLDRIRKCGRAGDIENSMRMAKKAGLEPHVTCMVGYPWESEAEARATVGLTRRLFERGHIDTLQATVVIPYPGTPLFRECREKGWLKTEDWDRYDMREPVMKTPMPDEVIMKLTRGIYTSFLTPRFIFRKLREIRSWRDLDFLFRAGLRVLGHLLDFQPHSKK